MIFLCAVEIFHSSKENSSFEMCPRDVRTWPKKFGCDWIKSIRNLRTRWFMSQD